MTRMPFDAGQEEVLRLTFSRLTGASRKGAWWQIAENAGKMVWVAVAALLFISLSIRENITTRKENKV